ncbi:MAG: flagellar biosynthesis anti-sigma factor FlgM [Desulfosarcina sp.]|jgi:negative regulator of flagellin synthesis FlgM
MEIPEKGPLPSLSVTENLTDNLPSAIGSTAPRQENGSTDSIRLTKEGREFQSAANQARLLPDVREERVQQLKRQLETGTYRVEGSRIAVNMIDESVENNSVLKHIDTKV